jgi:hypothetical protein
MQIGLLCWAWLIDTLNPRKQEKSTVPSLHISAADAQVPKQESLTNTLEAPVAKPSNPRTIPRMSSGKEICFMMHDGDVSLRQVHGKSGTQVMRIHKVGEWEVNVAVLRWLCNLSAWRFVVMLLRYSDSLDCEHELARQDHVLHRGSLQGARQDRLHGPGPGYRRAQMRESRELDVAKGLWNYTTVREHCQQP